LRRWRGTGCSALSADNAPAKSKHRHVTTTPCFDTERTAFLPLIFLCILGFAWFSHVFPPYGVAFVVDQIEKADKVYCDLSALLPGRVAVWTRDHDTHCKKPERLENPAARFAAEELRHYPVIVVTHKFYLGTRGHNARSVVRQGVFGQRALTIVDERPDEAPSLDLMLSEAEAVREAVIQHYPDAKEHLDALVRFMEHYNYAPSNKLYRPGLELDATQVDNDLGWFRTPAAERLAKSASNIQGVDKVFAFAKALVVGRACVATRPYDCWA
jgi:hypothetical protein